MPANEPKRRVDAQSQGPNRGVNVPIPRKMLEEAGVDPDEPIEVNRYVYDTDRAEIRLRFYNSDPDDDE